MTKRADTNRGSSDFVGTLSTLDNKTYRPSLVLLDIEKSPLLTNRLGGES